MTQTRPHERRIAVAGASLLRYGTDRAGIIVKVSARGRRGRPLLDTTTVFLPEMDGGLGQDV